MSINSFECLLLSDDFTLSESESTYDPELFVRDGDVGFIVISLGISKLSV